MLALKEQLISASIQVFIATFVVALVFIIFLTHRFVGPLVSISRFLRAHISGEQTSELKIRKNDELHEIVDLLNKLNQIK
jgi:signal transduction histidine kinase